MKHDVTVDGWGYRLRPIEIADAEFIVDVRTSDAGRSKFLHPISDDPELQRQWLAKYFERSGDYYWVVERRDTGTPEGLIGIYDLEPDTRIAMWGRWIIKSGSLAAVESALLIYKAAFEHLDLNAIYSIAITENKPVVSFHDSSGVPRVELIKDCFDLDGVKYDGVKHQCSKEHYPSVVEKLRPQAEMIQKRLNRSK